MASIGRIGTIGTGYSTALWKATEKLPQYLFFVIDRSPISIGQASEEEDDSMLRFLIHFKRETYLKRKRKKILVKTRILIKQKMWQ